MIETHALCLLQTSWEGRDFATFGAMLPTSLRALVHNYGGRVSLPHLGHLTNLTELCLDGTHLTPTGAHLPYLPALQVLSIYACCYGPLQLDLDDVGPRELCLVGSTPRLAKVGFPLGMPAPHQQLAALAPLAHLHTIVLDFGDYAARTWRHPDRLLPPDTLLNLPPSVTQLVLCDIDSCVPPVAIPDNIAVVYKSQEFTAVEVLHEAHGPQRWKVLAPRSP